MPSPSGEAVELGDNDGVHVPRLTRGDDALQSRALQVLAAESLVFNYFDKLKVLGCAVGSHACFLGVEADAFASLLLSGDAYVADGSVRQMVLTFSGMVAE
jgi:hypothetical protein